jgi:hypothetical protein
VTPAAYPRAPGLLYLLLEFGNAALDVRLHLFCSLVLGDGGEHLLEGIELLLQGFGPVEALPCGEELRGEIRRHRTCIVAR